MSVPETESLDAKGEITRHRVAVSSVESRYIYSVLAFFLFVFKSDFP